MKREEYSEYIQGGTLKTPAYVIDAAELERHVRRIMEIVGEDIGLCYAMKANPFVTQIVNRWIDKVEVCSPGELAICKRTEIPPENIIFSGVNKTGEDILEAVEYGVGVITLESYKQFELVRKYCREQEYPGKIYLRLSDGFQFGLNKDMLEKIISHRMDYPYLNICGIHYFSGTQKKNIESNIEELQMLRDYLEQLKKQYDFTPAHLEYGVGLYHPYYINEDFMSRYDGLTELVQLIRALSFPCKVVFEMGRFFAASCGDYLTEVQDLKSVNQKNYCLVDGGIHHLNYYGQNMAMRTPVIHKLDVLCQQEEVFSECAQEVQGSSKWAICGSLCTFADVLARNVEFETLRIGDILIFKNAGAYSMTEAPFLFLSRKMPGVYLFEKDKGIKKIRDFIASDKFVC